MSYSIIKTVGVPVLNQVNNVVISYTLQKDTVINGITTSSGTPLSYQLPLDVLILIDGKKIIAKSQITDGVEVFERIARKAHSIDIEFNMRGVQSNSTTLGTIVTEYVFPLNTDDNDPINPNSSDVSSFFDIVWLPDQVLDIQNSLLNALHIDKIIVESHTIKPERGSVDVNVRLKAYEVYYDNDSQSSSLVDFTI
jgi:hypothetical protein